MARIKRSTLFAYLAIVSTATAAVVAGCATSDEVEVDPGDTTPGTDGGKDARTADGRSTNDDEDSGSDGTKDSGQDTGGDDEDDAGGKDAGSDASDSGSDAGDAGKDAGPDGGDAGSDAGDAGVDAGNDAGDSGTGTAVKPAQGEVVISEVMFNPSTTEPDTEWIEIYNTAAGPRLLSGLVLKDGGTNPERTHTIGAGVEIAPGAYVVLASKRSALLAANVPAAAIVYEYGSAIQLANGSTGSIVLLDGAAEIARAKYGPAAPDGLGLSSADKQSIQLKVLTYAGAGDKANWCKSSNPWAAGSNPGTPGAASDCP
ncbi:MAG: hypothetical protein K0S65_2195 [Labilithrix sp.]|nr:hypothetical protein [Labilithrix sp.]